MMNIFSKLFSIYGFSTVYFSIGSIIFYLISITEPSNYIDEIFHVNQCLKYCEGNFYEVYHYFLNFILFELMCYIFKAYYRG